MENYKTFKSICRYFTLYAMMFHFLSSVFALEESNKKNSGGQLFEISRVVREISRGVQLPRSFDLMERAKFLFVKLKEDPLRRDSAEFTYQFLGPTNDILFEIRALVFEDGVDFIEESQNGPKTPIVFNLQLLNWSSQSSSEPNVAQQIPLEIQNLMAKFTVGTDLFPGSLYEQTFLDLVAFRVYLKAPGPGSKSSCGDLLLSPPGLVPGPSGPTLDPTVEYDPAEKLVFH